MLAEPDLEGLIQQCRRAFRRYGILAAVAVVVGIAAAVLGGLQTNPGSWIHLAGRAFGAVIAATGVVPMKGCLGIWGRIDGMHLLQRRWEKAVAEGANEATLENLRGLYREVLKRAVMGR